MLADNYATHKYSAVQRWLGKHPQFNVYFTPTSAPWLNTVERFFRDLTTERRRHGGARGDGSSGLDQGLMIIENARPGLIGELT